MGDQSVDDMKPVKTPESSQPVSAASPKFESNYSTFHTNLAEISGTGTWVAPGEEDERCILSTVSSWKIPQSKLILPAIDTDQPLYDTGPTLTLSAQASHSTYANCEIPAIHRVRSDSLLGAKSGQFASNFDVNEQDGANSRSRGASSINLPNNDNTGAWAYHADNVNIEKRILQHKLPHSAISTSIPANPSERPYTSGLQVDFSIRGETLPKLSVVSDAGEQQQLLQQRTFTSTFGKNGRSAIDQDVEEGFLQQPVPILQNTIFQALSTTKNNDVDDCEFLPNGKLCRVINYRSVVQELRRDLSHILAADQIDHYARIITKEHEIDRKHKKVFKSFRKVFALLVLVEMSSAIAHFLQEDVSDLDLPLFPVRTNGLIELRRRDDDGKASSESLRCFQNSRWTQTKLRNFQKEQWIMLAPFFAPGKNSDVKHYILLDQHILPYVASQDAELDDAECHGGYGKVTMVNIHDEHHDFPDKAAAKRGFAIKQLFANDEESFKREVNVLRKFSGERSHPHVVSLLATYKQRQKYHFIFYRAEGDLFRLWKIITRSPSFNYTTVCWMAQQCAGLAGGLSKLHRHRTFTILQSPTTAVSVRRNSSSRHVTMLEHVRRGRSDSMQSNGVRVRHFSPPSVSSRLHGSNMQPSTRPSAIDQYTKIQYGRHGDINPGNILWYSDNISGEVGSLGGTCKLADFGQAVLNSPQSKTSPRSIANTMTYRPPDCDVQPRIIRQSYDIWCLACVYLEFVAWILGGAELLEKFSEARQAPDIYHNNMDTDTFFEFVRDGKANVRVKESVHKFIADFHSHPRCTEYIHDLLILIKHDMLLVESDLRMSCTQVCAKLEKLHRKCMEDVTFAAEPRPWHRKECYVMKT